MTNAPFARGLQTLDVLPRAPLALRVVRRERRILERPARPAVGVAAVPRRADKEPLHGVDGRPEAARVVRVAAQRNEAADRHTSDDGVGVSARGRTAVVRGREHGEGSLLGGEERTDDVRVRREQRGQLARVLPRYVEVPVREGARVRRVQEAVGGGGVRVVRCWSHGGGWWTVLDGHGIYVSWSGWRRAELQRTCSCVCCWEVVER